LLEAAGGSWDKLHAELLESLKIKFNVEYQNWQPPQELIDEATRLGVEKYSTEKWNINHEF
jgi:hypothetical protein